MFRLHNPIREYAWGSRTAIAQLLGEAVPSPVPQAELWMGAHPQAPSWVLESDVGEVPEQGASLADRIAVAPERWLGKAVAERFHGELPFLFKVLAAEQPLSLQAHPMQQQASEGFAREEAAGVAKDAAERTYKDPRHKPELICALSHFEAWCGFREPEELAVLLASLPGKALAEACVELCDPAAQREPAGAIAACVQRLLQLPLEEGTELVRRTADACDTLVQREPHHPFADACAWVPRLARRYPGDPGVVLTLLLNHVKLEPGEALYMPAGTLHAYAQGMGVELMANSDNVVRGGLTQKPIAIAELTRTLTWQPRAASLAAGEEVAPGVVRYTAPVEEFALHRVEPGTPQDRARMALNGGPAIVLVTRGTLTLQSDHDGRCLDLPQGGCAYVLPESRAVHLRGEASAFVATMPHGIDGDTAR